MPHEPMPWDLSIIPWTTTFVLNREVCFEPTSKFQGKPMNKNETNFSGEIYPSLASIIAMLPTAVAMYWFLTHGPLWAAMAVGVLGLCVGKIVRQKVRAAWL